MTTPGGIATRGLALYAGHHVGDYWVQTDHQAAHKGGPGFPGAWACLKHVATYTATQAVCVGMTTVATGRRPKLGRLALGLAISAVTHYASDRREFGLMVKAARAIPGKERFLKLGVPRVNTTRVDEAGTVVPLDNPSLGTGAWALDQSWHVFFGVFVPALVMGEDA